MSKILWDKMSNSTSYYLKTCLSYLEEVIKDEHLLDKVKQAVKKDFNECTRTLKLIVIEYLYENLVQNQKKEE